MVDREARRQYAQLIRRLANGKIDEDEIDKALGKLPLSGKDRVFGAIFEESFSIKTTPRRDVARWILFLQSNTEYEWPGVDQQPNPYFVIACVLMCFLLGGMFHNLNIGFWLTACGAIPFMIFQQWLVRRHTKPGDLTVWPFHQQVDLDEAVRHPRLLNGNRLI